MKIIQKTILILIIITCTFGITNINISEAASVTDTVKVVKPEEVDSTKYNKLQSTVGKLLGFLQISSGLITVLVIAFTGFNYIIATPDVKKDIKDKALPILIGIILVFSAVSISKFLLGVVGDEGDYYYPDHSTYVEGKEITDSY